jgi:hypothetical protein
MNRFVLVCVIASLLNCSPDYQSGSTKCSPEGTCPDGFVCGDDSYAGAPSVCYEVGKTTCSSAPGYYCPATATCWESRVACDTVVFCGVGNPNACVSEGYVPDCSNSGKCKTAGSGGTGGGSGGAGGSTSCPSSSTASACTVCLNQSCCSQWVTCQGQTACQNLVNCIDACATGDTTCTQNCSSSYSAGNSSLTSFVNCGNSYCKTICN